MLPVVRDSATDIGPSSQRFRDDAGRYVLISAFRAGNCNQGNSGSRNRNASDHIPNCGRAAAQSIDVSVRYTVNREVAAVTTPISAISPTIAA
jgi:hypothetical protein